MKIAEHIIGDNAPAYVIAEMSANHHQDFEQAVRIIEAAKEAGADAIKMQTYTADTLTINCDNAFFRVGKGTIWEGMNLYRLYQEACTPWAWQPKLKRIANDLGLDCFSTPFDATSVEFLEAMDVPAHKIASFEVVDIDLLQRIARTGKPIIMSTGMCTLQEIEEAVQTIRQAGGKDLALLKCTSAYPAPPEEMNLRMIPDLARRFGVPVGLSDHTTGIAAPVAGVVLGACIIEKHLTLSRLSPGPDSAFSLEPSEFKDMVAAVRMTERLLGRVNYQITENETASRAFRRSLFVVCDMKEGELFTEQNVRSIRPAYGLHPRHLHQILGARALSPISMGTPLSWDLVRTSR